MNILVTLTCLYSICTTAPMLIYIDSSVLITCSFICLSIELLSVVFLDSQISLVSYNFIANILNLVSDFLSLTIPVILKIDNISIIFFSILLSALILCLIFLFSYFEYDKSASTIILLSSIFSQLAFLFFSSGDMFSLIFFWELISFVSFLLIQHWIGRVNSIKAAMKVFSISQFGDLLFLLSIFTILNVFEGSDLSVILSTVVLYNNLYIIGLFHVNLISIISVGLLSAVLLKSAQFIFFPWLLDAMEAPVPISAQLHSSTLVIIGFYVFFRFFSVIFTNDNLMILIFTCSFLTIVGATVLGFYQNDGKKLLACSTASQLGYVLMSSSMLFINESIMLLVFCCCNKALTFVWFGVIMDNNSGISDFRLMRGVNLNNTERSGLMMAMLSSTILPGSFAWQVKALLFAGTLSIDNYLFIIFVSIISLTWFLSSIYLIKVFYYVFCIPTCSSYSKNTTIVVNITYHVYVILLLAQALLLTSSIMYLMSFTL